MGMLNWHRRSPLAAATTIGVLLLQRNPRCDEKIGAATEIPAEVNNGRRYYQEHGQISGRRPDQPARRNNDPLKSNNKIRSKEIDSIRLSTASVADHVRPSREHHRRLARGHTRSGDGSGRARISNRCGHGNVHTKISLSQAPRLLSKCRLRTDTTGGNGGGMTSRG